MSQRPERIEATLKAAFSPTEVLVKDQSHLHAGHAGAQDGKGHFDVRIVSEAFDGRTAIQRHRMVYAALADMMQTDIHALRIDAKTPAESNCFLSINEVNRMFPTLRAVRACTALAAVLALSAHALAEPVATVNGIEIDSAVFENYLASRLQKPAEQATPDEREAVLSELKDIYLLSSQPKAKELAESPEVEAQMEIQRRGILAQAVVTDFLASNEASEEEIFDEYTAQMALAPKSQFKARHILVETQDKASELITELDGGADFAELARENSTGPTGSNGGDLGWFAPEQMVPEFSSAVQGLDDGAYTKEPVQTQFGWHVILREDTRATEPPPLDSLRDRIKQRVESQKFQAYLNELRGDGAD